MTSGRRAFVLTLEGTLLAIVMATAAYYGLVTLDEGRTVNERMLAGWIAVLLIGLTFAGPIRRRIEQRGTREASDYASIFFGAVILLIILTAAGLMIGARKHGPSLETIWCMGVMCTMFFWPEVRHRIATGEWRRT